MDLAPVGIVSQLQNTNYTLGNVFFTTLFTTLGMEGLRAIVGETLSLSLLVLVHIEDPYKYFKDKIHSSHLVTPIIDIIQVKTRRDSN